MAEQLIEVILTHTLSLRPDSMLHPLLIELNHLEETCHLQSVISIQITSSLNSSSRSNFLCRQIARLKKLKIKILVKRATYTATCKA